MIGLFCRFMADESEKESFHKETSMNELLEIQRNESDKTEMNSEKKIHSFDCR